MSEFRNHSTEISRVNNGDEKLNSKLTGSLILPVDDRYKEKTREYSETQRGGDAGE